VNGRDAETGSAIVEANPRDEGKFVVESRTPLWAKKSVFLFAPPKADGEMGTLSLPCANAVKSEENVKVCVPRSHALPSTSCVLQDGVFTAKLFEFKKDKRVMDGTEPEK
jgi:hypothetical protein